MGAPSYSTVCCAAVNTAVRRRVALHNIPYATANVTHSHFTVLRFEDRWRSRCPRSSCVLSMWFCRGSFLSLEWASTLQQVPCLHALQNHIAFFSLPPSLKFIDSALKFLYVHSTCLLGICCLVGVSRSRWPYYAQLIYLDVNMLCYMLSYALHKLRPRGAGSPFLLHLRGS